MKGTTTEKRVDVWANSQPIGLAIERLYQMHLDGTAEKVLFVKYEDLAKDPDSQIKRIYKYLELPYFKHDFNNVAQVTVEDDSVYGVYGDHKIRSAVKPLKSDAKEVLGNHAYNWIRNNYQWFYDTHRYY